MMATEMAAETVSLQERLNLIQQQQVERFRARKTLVIKRENHQKANELTTTIKAKIPGDQEMLDPDTNLDLRTATQELDKGSTLTTDGSDYLSSRSGSKSTLAAGNGRHAKETEYLRRQLEELSLENTKLKSELKEKEQKMKIVEKAREEERVALGTAGTNATQRIVELSKRNRELSAELATEKNRLRQVQKKMKEPEMSSAHRDAEHDSTYQSHGQNPQRKSTKNPTPKSNDDSSVGIAKVQDELQQAKLKMAEQRNQCQVLKQELKLAQKVISKEVGEGVSMSALLSGASGWRGRAQQILTLQNKVAELGEQLRQAKQESSTRIDRVVSGEHCGHPVAMPMVDTRQQAALNKIATGKQRSLDEVKSELETLKTEHSKILQQCSALKARNKTLASSVKSLKEQITSRTEKQTKNDRDIVKFVNSDGHTSQEENDTLTELEREKRLLSQENRALRAQLAKTVKQSRLSENDYHSVSPAHGLSLPPVRTTAREHLRSRGQTGRKAASAGQPLVSLCPHSEANEPTLLDRVTQIERERLLELTSCLQQRLDAMTDKFVRLEAEIRTLRQQNARLEKVVGRSRNCTLDRDNKGTNEGKNVEELETQLAIQLDVNAVLKETLELTRHEKMEDIKQYQAILQEVKKLFLDNAQKN